MAGEARAQAREVVAFAHVAAVEPAALLLERDDELVELTPAGDVGRHERRLQLADAILQHVQIVQTSQRVLNALQQAKIGRRFETRDIGRDFERVAQLLGGDPDDVQALGQIDSAGLAHRRREGGRAVCDARIDRPLPRSRRGTPGRRLCLVAFDRAPDFLELRGEPREFRNRALGREMSTGVFPLFANERADPHQRRGRIPIRVGQLVDHREQDIQFSHRPEPLRHLAQATTQFVGGVGIQLQNGQNFAKTTGRDPRAVDRADVTVLEAV